MLERREERRQLGPFGPELTARLQVEPVDSRRDACGEVARLADSTSLGLDDPAELGQRRGHLCQRRGREADVRTTPQGRRVTSYLRLLQESTEEPLLGVGIASTDELLVRVYPGCSRFT